MKRLLLFAWILLPGILLVAAGLYVSGWLFYFGLAWLWVLLEPKRHLTAYTVEFWLVNAVAPVLTLTYGWLLRALVSHMRCTLHRRKLL